MKRNAKMVLAAVAMAAAFGATGAHAGGLLGDILIRPFSPDAADALDDAHRQMGQPLDRVGMQAGTAVTGIPFGQFCGTPVGRFGPGPINPVGTPCNVGTPAGTYFGVTVQ